jgi:hypothetical protein
MKSEVGYYAMILYCIEINRDVRLNSELRVEIQHEISVSEKLLKFILLLIIISLSSSLL